MILGIQEGNERKNGLDRAILDVKKIIVIYWTTLTLEFNVNKQKCFDYTKFSSVCVIDGNNPLHYIKIT